MKNDTVPEQKISLAQKIRRFFRESLDIAILQSQIARLLPPGQNATDLFRRLNHISRQVRCAHNPSHALAFILDMLLAPRNEPGCFVEAGCFKGGSTAKFSVIAKMLGRDLVIFDSFEGLPENQEAHVQSLQGHSIAGWFAGGSFCGSLDEVKNNITRYGEISVCHFVKGFFDDSMPKFTRPILAGFLDVDLASSTKSCLKYLFPLLVKGGVLCSQDGDFPLVMEVFKDAAFWRDEVGIAPPPPITGLGEKITRIRKPANRTPEATGGMST